MEKVTFFLTPEQFAVVQPLFHELARLNLAAQANGAEMDGAAIGGQLMWYEGDWYPRATFNLIDAAMVQTIIAATQEVCHDH